MEDNGDHQLFGYPYSSKYLLLCLAEERIRFILGWTIPVMIIKPTRNKNCTFRKFSEHRKYRYVSLYIFVLAGYSGQEPHIYVIGKS